jgi:hypothetical protein
LEDKSMAAESRFIEIDLDEEVRSALAGGWM